MKQNHRCPKCESLAVGHLYTLPDTLASETEVGRRFLGTIHSKDGGKERVSLIEAYVCTTCGYLETYVQDPADVPFDKIDGLSLPKVNNDYPYR